MKLASLRRLLSVLRLRKAVLQDFLLSTESFGISGEQLGSPGKKTILSPFTSLFNITSNLVMFSLISYLSGKSFEPLLHLEAGICLGFGMVQQSVLQLPCGAT